MAAAVIAALEHRWPRRWIAFIDLAGATVQMRSRLIECVCESTSKQRQSGRDFHRASHEEHKAGRRPWEENDFW